MFDYALLVQMPDLAKILLTKKKAIVAASPSLRIFYNYEFF